MDVTSLKNELSIRSKNGVAFLLSGAIIWIIITVIFLQEIDIATKNIFMLFSTGIMFPTAILFSKLVKADWNTNDHPLGSLGLSFNIAQFLYFPLIFWAFANSPEQMVLFFAVITAAHFYLYGWLYNTKAYYFISPIGSIFIMIIGWTLGANKLWIIPLFMVGFLLVLVGWLWVDYKRKVANVAS